MKLEPLNELNGGGRNEFPWVASDGLTIYFQASLDGGNVLAFVTRSSLTAPWQSAQTLPVSLPDSVPGALTWPFVTADQRWLFCSGETRAVGGRIMLFRRPSADGPFEGPVFLTQPGTRELLFGRAPRYVEKTKELFFSAPNPITGQSNWSTSNWDIWVIRGFDPTTAWQTGAKQP